MSVNKTVEQIIFEGIDKISAPTKQAKEGVADLRKTVDGVKDALSAVGVTVGAGVFVKLQLDAMKATAALDDMAEMTGASVEGLSAIQRVARVGGHDFDGLTGQIGKMIKGLKEGGEEGSKAAMALEFLDVKAKDANGRFRDTSVVLLDVAKKMEQYEGGGNKVALINDILGKGSERYIPLLKEMAEGTDLQATVTAKMAEEAEKAEKNINRLKVSMEDARRETVNEFTPSIIKLTDQLLAAAKASGGFWSGLNQFLSVSGNQAEDPLASLEAVEQKLKTLRADRAVLGGPGMAASFNRMMAPEDLAMLDRQIAHAERQQSILRELLVRRVSGNAAGLVEDASGNVGPAPGPARLNYQSGDPKKGLTPFESAVLQRQQAAAKASSGDNEFTSTQLDIQAGKYGKLTEAQKQHLLQLAAIAEQQKGMREFNKRTADEVEAMAKATGEYNEKLRVSSERYRDIVDPTREYWREQEHLNELLRQGAITQEEFYAIQGRLVETRTNVVRIAEGTTMATDAAHSLGLSFASAFDRIADGSGRSINALDLLAAAAMDVAKVVWGKQVTGPLAGGIERGLSGLFKENGIGMNENEMLGIGFEQHTGGIAGVDGRRRSVHPAYFEGARRMHAGGIAGDEVPTILQRGEEVLTRRDPRHRANGGGGSVFNIDARGADREGLARLERTIRQLDGTIERRAVAAVFTNRSRGGV